MGMQTGDVRWAALDVGTAQDKCPEGQNNCMTQVLDTWSTQGNATMGNKAIRLAAAGAPAEQREQRPDIQWGQFNAEVPLSHFSPIDTKRGVYRSGRPNGDAGVAEEVKSIWGHYSETNAQKTTIIELRGEEKGKFHDQNEAEKKSERDAAAARNVTHVDFPMHSQEFQSPQKLQSVVDYIDRQTKHGQRVVMHCFHGTDRTGLVSEAWELTHQYKDDVRYRPNHALDQSLERMRQQGFVPENYPQLVKSLDRFIGWKHEEMIKAEQQGK